MASTKSTKTKDTTRSVDDSTKVRYQTSASMNTPKCYNYPCKISLSQHKYTKYSWVLQCLTYNKAPGEDFTLGPLQRTKQQRVLLKNCTSGTQQHEWSKRLSYQSHALMKRIPETFIGDGLVAEPICPESQSW